MFRWASKQKAANRQSIQKQFPIKIQSHPCSPANSTANTPKSNQQNRSATQVRRVSLKKPCTPQKNSGKYKWQEIGQKQDLISLFDKKLKKLKKTDNSSKKSIKTLTSDSKIVIKLTAHYNLMLSQFCMAHLDLRDKVWNIYIFAVMLLRMGFIADLVQDRELVKNIWVQLVQPDLLGLYVFIEKALGNRVNLENAAKTLQAANSKVYSRKAAQIIITHDFGSNYYSLLKYNRICRKQGVHCHD